MSLFDTHAHLDEDSLYSELENVLEHARKAGVERILTIGIHLESCRKAVLLAEGHEMIFAAVGLHPNYVTQAAPGDWEAICEFTQHEKVVAVGETGLDLYWDFAPLDVQKNYFTKHLELSRQTGLPFIVHCRDAEAELLEHLQPFAEAAPLNGIMHSFCGSTEAAKTYLEWGMHLSYSGMATFKKNDRIRELARATPADRILVETDCPYLAPVPYRGKRNEPAYVAHVADCLAEARQETVESFRRLTTENALRLFGI